MSQDPRFQSKVAGLSVDELSAALRAAMIEVEKQFPKGVGVAVFTFDMDAAGAGGFGWIANANREDMIAALVEWIQVQRGRN